MGKIKTGYGWLPNIVGDEPPLALSQRMQRELSYRLLPTTKTSAPLLDGESKFDYSISGRYCKRQSTHL